jgi:hypothetical protein
MKRREFITALGGAAVRRARSLPRCCASATPACRRARRRIMRLSRIVRPKRLRAA